MSVIKYILSLVVGILVGWGAKFFVQGVSWEQLKSINNNYANIIGLLISTIAAIVTTVYVIFTYRQMRASERATALAEQSATCSQIALETNQDMVASMKLQLKQANHPCLSPSIKRTIGTDCFYENRRQLYITVEVKNIGNGPAISIYGFAWFVLKHTQQRASSLVPMEFVPSYKPHLEVGKKCECRMRFETKEIEALLEDLRISNDLNMDRIQNRPSDHPYPGTDLLIKIYYRNISNQWYEISYQREIYSIVTEKKESEEDDGYPYTFVGEKEVPPDELLPTDVFKLQLVSEAFSGLDIKMVEASVIQSLLIAYEEYLPNPFTMRSTIQ
ncbi:hypothetical protein [Pelosinus fermentans]|uniref:Uncharacterized protein n=1 Tax=Pelosinus fermentans JBW45 TaxID=1192197 RepID=I8U011_9FIRM|nr:hypothetical protein [Pelosinus fermentans]AJQ29354.1 hypothetical protein JBW_04017 [Pelosinus fermentans JBW45]